MEGETSLFLYPFQLSTRTPVTKDKLTREGIHVSLIEVGMTWREGRKVEREGFYARLGVGCNTVERSDKRE